MNLDLSHDLLPLLPPVYREVGDYQQICKAEQAEFELLAQGIEGVQDDFFLQTMGEDAIARWEKVFSIVAKPMVEPLDFRRQRILTRLSTRPPYTLGFLHQKLDELIGTGRWDCTVDYPAYTLNIKADAEKEASRGELPFLVNQIKPAHIVFRLCLFFDPASARAYAAGAPCGTAARCTIRLPDFTIGGDP